MFKGHLKICCLRQSKTCLDYVNWYFRALHCCCWSWTGTPFWLNTALRGFFSLLARQKKIDGKMLLFSANSGL